MPTPSPLEQLKEALTNKNESLFIEHIPPFIEELLKEESYIHSAKHRFQTELLKLSTTTNLELDRKFFKICGASIARSLVLTDYTQTSLVKKMKEIGLDSITNSAFSKAINIRRREGEFEHLRKSETILEMIFYLIVATTPELMEIAVINTTEKINSSSKNPPSEELHVDHKAYFKSSGKKPITKILIIHDDSEEAKESLISILKNHEAEKLKVFIQSYNCCGDNEASRFDSLSSAIAWANNVCILYTKNISSDQTLINTIMKWAEKKVSRSMVCVEFFVKNDNPFRQADIKMLSISEASYLLSHLHEQANSRTERFVNDLESQIKMYERETEQRKKWKMLTAFAGIAAISLALLAWFCHDEAKQKHVDQFYLLSQSLTPYLMDLADSLGTSSDNLGINLWIEKEKDRLLQVALINPKDKGTIPVPDIITLGKVGQEERYIGVANYAHAISNSNYNYIFADDAKSGDPVYKSTPEAVRPVKLNNVTFKEASKKHTTKGRKIVLCKSLTGIKKLKSVVVCVDVFNDDRVVEKIRENEVTKVIGHSIEQVISGLSTHLGNLSFNYMK